MQSPGAAAWSSAQAKAVLEMTLSALTATITFAAASPPRRQVCPGFGGNMKRRQLRETGGRIKGAFGDYGKIGKLNESVELELLQFH